MSRPYDGQRTSLGGGGGGAVTTHEAAADPHTGYQLESLYDAKGDLIAASADNTPAKLTVGANNTVLVADSAQTSGVKWAAVPAHASRHYVDGADPIAALMPGLRSGTWYGPQTGASSASALVANTLYAVPFFVGRTATLTDIACEVTVAAPASTVRLAIYDDTGEAAPGALALNAGTVDSTGTGFLTITISHAVTRGLIWLAAVAQGGTPTVASQAGNVVPVGHPSAGGAGGNWSAYTQTGVSGALPGTFTVGSPNFGVRVLVRAS